MRSRKKFKYPACPRTFVRRTLSEAVLATARDAGINRQNYRAQRSSSCIKAAVCASLAFAKERRETAWS